MFLSLFPRSLFALNPKCLAPTTLPKPLSDQKLFFSQVLISYGSRAPLTSHIPSINRGYWLCDSDEAPSSRIYAAPVNHYRRFRQIIDTELVDYLPSCRTGDITLLGMRQEQELGDAFHDYLFINSQTALFDSEPVDPNFLYIRSSDQEVTLRSAQAFLQGAFPPKSPNEIFDIYQDSSDGSLLRIHREWCQDLTDLYTNVNSTSEWSSWVSDTFSYLEQTGLPQLLSITHPTADNIYSICDLVVSFACNGKLLPLNISDEVVDKCLSARSHYLYTFYGADRSIAGSYTMREMVRIARSSIGGSVKFSLLSSHEQTLAAVRTFLGVPETEPDASPAMASHLVMELWSNKTNPSTEGDFTVRFALNGEDIPLKLIDQEPTSASFSDFLTKYSDMNDKCITGVFQNCTSSN